MKGLLPVAEILLGPVSPPPSPQCGGRRGLVLADWCCGGDGGDGVVVS